MPRHPISSLLFAAMFLGANLGLAEEKPAPAALKVTLDVSETPELEAWGKKAQTLVAEWHPKISKLLESEGFTAPAEVKLVFKKDMKGVAGTAGTTIYIAANWVKEHPDDFGMVIHELTHVIQSYPKYEHVWLVEGIADYIRFFHFEPDTRLPPIDPAKAGYRDGYKVTAPFLAWIARTHSKELVGKLNAALRRTAYQDELFKEATGKSLEDLWKEFAASLKKE